MPNFNRSFTVDGALLEFCFSLIHRPGGPRYAVVSHEQQYVASFYFEQNDWGIWKLSDRYQTAPRWVHALESLLTETITKHNMGV